MNPAMRADPRCSPTRSLDRNILAEARRSRFVDGLLRRALVAGSLAGIAGFATFFAIHYVWIVPIWDILPFGLAFAVLGGAAVGWAYDAARARLPAGPASYAALGGLLLLTMAPAQIAVLLRGPIPINLFDQTPGWWIGYLEAELLVTAALVGAGIGARLVRTARGAGIWALAGGAYGWTVGHNIPLLGAGGTFLKVALLVVGPTIVATLVFGLADRRA